MQLVCLNETRHYAICTHFSITLCISKDKNMLFKNAVSCGSPDVTDPIQIRQNRRVYLLLHTLHKQRFRKLNRLSL